MIVSDWSMYRCVRQLARFSDLAPDPLNVGQDEMIPPKGSQRPRC